MVEQQEMFAFRAVEDDHGSFYVVWAPLLEDGSYALVGRHGKNPGEASKLVTGFEIAQGVSALQNWDAFPDGQGNLIVTWEKGSHIRAQRWSPDQKPLWPLSKNAVTVSTYPETFPTGVGDGSGGAYLVWSEKRYAERWVLMMQHLNPMGAPLWPAEGIRVSLRPSDQRSAKVVPDGQAGVIVTWRDFRENASQLQTQRMDYQGNRLWGLEGILVTAPIGNVQETVRVGALGKGSAVYAWEASQAGTSRVLLQVVSSTGTLEWDLPGMEASDEVGDQWNVVAYGDLQGNTWVAWEDHRNEENWQLFMQRFDSEGHSDWGDELALAPVHGDQGHVVLTDDRRQGIFAVWLDNRSGTTGLYGQEVDTSGHLLRGPEGITLAERLVHPTAAQVVPLGPGQAEVFWADQEAKGRWSLFTKTITSSPPLKKGD